MNCLNCDKELKDISYFCNKCYRIIRQKYKEYYNLKKYSRIFDNELANFCEFKKECEKK
jgi:hypothetical protein